MALGNNHAPWSRKRDLKTRIRICTSILHPEMSVDEILDSTSDLNRMKLPELEKLNSEMHKGLPKKGNRNV
jgi:hypothetical protein